MIRELWDKIKNKEDVRQNLIQIKTLLKEGQNKFALLYYLGNDFRTFDELLENEDAKVRKNTALVMGQLGVEGFMKTLYEAYEKENTLFVKSSYLTAIREFDYRSLLPRIKERLEYLSQVQPEESDKKHIAEEVKILSEMVLTVEGVKKHEFTGYHQPSKVILLTNRDHKEVTLDQMKSLKAKTFTAGVMVKVEDLNEILPIRTYQTLLFVLEDLQTCPMGVKEAAEAIAESNLIDFLEKRHKGTSPFYFRLELKTKMDLNKKSIFAKKLASEIEGLTGRKLVNTTSNYEVELRLIETKEGMFNVLMKLFTLTDERFAYRKKTIAASIQPVNAALIVALAKDYLKENAQVLDPFCGVGTMLIERHKLVAANTMYGLDIYKEAIDGARENSQVAGTIAHYINRDFFDFKHEYLFDEIITNMPRVMGHKGEEEIFQIYQKVFQKAKEHLKEDGVFILYSHNRDLVRKSMNKRDYRLEEEIEISRKEGAYLVIGRKN